MAVPLVTKAHSQPALMSIANAPMIRAVSPWYESNASFHGKLQHTALAWEMGEGFDWEFDWAFDWKFDWALAWGFDWGSLSLTSGRHGNAVYAASFTKNSHAVSVAADADAAADNEGNDDAYSRFRRAPLTKSIFTSDPKVRP